MLKTGIFVIIFITLFSFLFYFKGDKVQKINVISPNSRLTVTPSKSLVQQDLKRSIFVPYWTLKNDLDMDGFDEVFYFGITANMQGIDKDDQGYKAIDRFIGKVEINKKKLLVVRLTNSKINSEILDNTKLQQKIINDSIEIAKKNKFDGIVLDFEISSLYFDSVVKNINNFSKYFYESSKIQNLMFYLTIYGDNFYRLRPYDISFLAKNSDKLMIMVYDFHKARGNPGPNFPYTGKEVYGYDFKTMINDFLKKIPAQKVTIIFGLFGYDWPIDDKGQSIKSGIPISENEIDNKFIKKCIYKNCNLEKSKDSLEPRISYIDEDSKPHVIWFESLESINKKIEYLKSSNINSVSYWAYSYF